MFEITVPTKEDIDEILRIAAVTGLSEWSRNGYLAELDRPDAIFLLANDEMGKTFGFIVGRLVPGTAEHSTDAEIYNIGVLPEYRRLRVGSELIRTFLLEAAKKGATQVFLEVRWSNISAFDFYRQMGFIVQYSRPSYYFDPIEDATVMRLIV